MTKLAGDLAEQLKRDPDKVAAELDVKLRADLKRSGDFARIHALPRSGADVPDDYEARLVVLSADHPYSKESGNAAETTPKAAVAWQAYRLTGIDALAVWVGKKLRSGELLVASLGSTILRKHLDDVPLWRGDSVSVKQLVDDFGRYLYLPRIAGSEVLAQSLRDGFAMLTWRKDTFAFAEGYDEAQARYRGLMAGQTANVSPDSTGPVVKPDVAARQLDAEVESQKPQEPREKGGDQDRREIVDPPPPPQPPPVAAQLRRFHGSVRVDPTRVVRDAGRIADEVITHLAARMGAEVSVTIEIEALLPNGASDQLVRTVTENSRSLKFDSQGFEKD